ncbi:MAG: HD domain-containing protein [Candidatus Omnitrophota bacterium]
MRFLTNKIKKIPYFSKLASLAKKNNIEVYLVGGALRDFIIAPKKNIFDFDFAVSKGASLIARKFAKVTGGSYVVLDEENKSYRVVVKEKKQCFQYDFTAFRGKDISGDLLGRDYSVNALAVSVNLYPKAKLIDNCNALSDLKRKIIRTISQKALKEDPLRIIRAFSLMSRYKFTIERETLRLISLNKTLIKSVAGERINEELYKIFSAVNSYSALRLMSDTKVLDEIFPCIRSARGVYQGRYHHLDVWNHSLEALKKYEVMYTRKLMNNPGIFKYLNQEIIPGRSRNYIVKLASLLHDIGKPLAKKKKGKKTIFHTHEKIGRDLAEQLGSRLKLSFKETDTLKKYIFWHLRPGYLADRHTPSKRAVYRFFRDTQDEGVAVILLSIGDWRATRGPEIGQKKRIIHERILFKLTDSYFKDKAKLPIAKLVDGYDIMRKFSLRPSVLIGKILKSVKEEQALGKIKSRADAYNLAKKIITNSKKRG